MNDTKAGQRLVYFNGKFVPEKEAKVSIYDSSLMFGDMIFEMTRSFNKKQFKLKDHLTRLFTGLKIMRININLNITEFEEACLETIKVNEPFFDKNDEHRLLINVSRGPLGIYAPIFDNKIEPTIIIADFPLKWTVAGLAKFFKSGVNLVIPSQRAIPSHLMDPKIKNRSRLWYQMANIEVSMFQGDNNLPLLIDPDGFIAEGTGDNFFIIKKNKIITPVGRNILRGISRDYIFELAEQLNIDCIEANIEPYDVYEADEAFVTATPFCIMPVKSLNNIIISNDKNQVFGKITKKLLDRWSNNVGVDIEKQILDYSNEINLINNQSNPTPYEFKSKK